jgi:hypothetical protein
MRTSRRAGHVDGVPLLGATAALKKGQISINLCEAFMLQAKPDHKFSPGKKRLPFECIALLLQGGGALGSYQAGVYQGLAEANLHPDWVAGVSIGAVNSALIAGNAPEKRVEKLREFWEAVSSPPLGPFGVPHNPLVEIEDELTHRLLNQTRALGIILLGAPQFFKPRFPPPVLWPSPTPDAVSYYDVAPLMDKQAPFLFSLAQAPILREVLWQGIGHLFSMLRRSGVGEVELSRQWGIVHSSTEGLGSRISDRRGPGPSVSNRPVVNSHNVPPGR